LIICKTLSQYDKKRKIVCPSQSPGFTPGLWGVRITHLFSFLLNICFCRRCVSYARSCLCLWIVHSWFLLRFSLTFTCWRSEMKTLWLISIYVISFIIWYNIWSLLCKTIWCNCSKYPLTEGYKLNIHVHQTWLYIYIVALLSVLNLIW
jgi:hypothetical protein